jgi:hypothetical protein
VLRSIGRLVRFGERSGLWAAAALAFGLHARHLWNLGALTNRYYGHWQRADALALIANLTLATLLAWGAIQAAMRLLRGRLPAPAARAAAIAARAGTLFAPVVLATAVQLLARPEWGSDLDPLDPPPPRAAPAGADALPVYVFVFDEWSWAQSTAAGRLQPFLFHLSRLAERSFSFERAWSPSTHTKVVLAKLLFPGEGRSHLELDEDTASWRRGGERVPTPEAESVFVPFARRGYRTALVGFYLPYRRLLGEQVDVVRSEPHAPRGSGSLERMRLQALASLRFLPERWRREAYSRGWWQLGRRVRDDVLRILSTWPAATFLFSHWPLPHPPFVLESDGSYRGPYASDRREGGAEDYRRHLLYLDRVVGEVVGALESAGRFDASLLVLTGDHGWHEHDADLLHVPLLVKWPHQRTAEVVAGRFSTLDLAGLVELVARGESDLADARRYIAAHAR